MMRPMPRVTRGLIPPSLPAIYESFPAFQLLSLVGTPGRGSDYPFPAPAKHEVTPFMTAAAPAKHQLAHLS
jgi:hypothetical protein